MYVYIPGYYAKIDFVRYTYEQGFFEGDLISRGDVVGICLGEEISFTERYDKERLPPTKVQLMKKNFFSKNTMSLIHWMTREWFTTYKKVFSLYLPKQRLKYIDVLDKGIESYSPMFKYDNGIFKPTQNKINGQQLFVFSDLRTIKNTFDNKILESDSIGISYNSMTSRQKMLMSNNIKSGKINILLATSSEVFQDWNDLQHIYFVDSYKRYYDNFKDPRYKISKVLKEMSKINNTTLEIYNI